MPYLNVRLAQDASAETTEKLVNVLMQHTAEILGKKPEVTSIDVEYVSSENWFVGGKRMSEQEGTTFYLDIKVTEGTNTKAEKADYVCRVFADFESVLGTITAASYIVIHDVRADSWGFQGKTQEYRFISSQAL